jgi:hypothetical protein
VGSLGGRCRLLLSCFGAPRFFCSHISTRSHSETTVIRATTLACSSRSYLLGREWDIVNRFMWSAIAAVSGYMVRIYRAGTRTSLIGMDMQEPPRFTAKFL